MALLQTIASFATLLFVVTGMATAGLGLGGAEVVAPLRNGRLLLGALAANFVVAPGIAYGLTRLLPLEPAHAVGLLLLGGAAGAPFLPKLVEFAKGDFAVGVGLMFLLMTGSAVFMPLALPWMIPGLNVEPWLILKPLLMTMLLPLGLGMLIRGRFPYSAAWLRAALTPVCNVSMVVAVALLLGLNLRAILATFGTGAIAIGALFVALLLPAGYLLGGPDPRVRSALSLGTAQRNIAGALLLAMQNFEDTPGVMAMLLGTTFAGLALEIVAARRLARWSPGVTAPEAHPS